MRRVDRLDDLDEALGAARRESRSSFGSDALILEKLVEGARHVEVQILADASGRVVPILERDCSLQRRHQKLVEECPSPRVDAAARTKLLTDAGRLASAGGYENAGTLEFLLTPKGEAWFLEMNTRLQVEHPVTELVCGLDLVAWQLTIACGIGFTARRPVFEPRGHAIEARVYAEDPASGFLPQSGTLTRVRWPEGPGIRVDAGVRTGSVVTPYYDPLLAKIVAWGADREEARRRLALALRETFLAGITTNVPFLAAALRTPRFKNGDYDTASVERGGFELDPAAGGAPPDALLLAAAALRERPAATGAGARVPDVPGASGPEPGAVAGPWDAADTFRIVGGAGRD
jgi:acetyl/propionyl-CoA carboxylase alpha subunit